MNNDLTTLLRTNPALAARLLAARPGFVPPQADVLRAYEEYARNTRRGIDTLSGMPETPTWEGFAGSGKNPPAPSFARTVQNLIDDPMTYLSGLGAVRTVAGPAVLGAGTPVPWAKKLGQGGGRKGTVTKQRMTPFRGRKRAAFPGIYGNPRELAEAPTVAPENPMMAELWGVTRKDLHDIALSRQGNLPDWKPEATPKNPKGSADAERIMTPTNTQRVEDILSAARERKDLAEGMIGWYVMDPVYQRMAALLGHDKAKRLYHRMQSVTGLASPGSDVLTEFNRGSRAAWMAEQNAFPEFLKYGGAKKSELKKTPLGRRPIMAGLQGHAYHSTSQAKPMQRFLESLQGKHNLPTDMYVREGTLGNAAKVPAYVMAARPPELGFQTRYPVGDAHYARGLGLADVRGGKGYAQSATLPEMISLQPWYRDIAARVGLESVPAQALQWGTLGPQTGVQTAVGQPKLELLTEAILTASKRTGLPPDVVRDMYLRAELPVGTQATPQGLLSDEE